ncbi:glycosyltransferase family 39 protein [Streptomyces sp. NPDC002845]
MTDLDTRPAAPLVRRAAPALLGYAAVRALGLVVLALWSATRDKSAHTLLSARWDSLWYVRVADLGYGYEVRLPNGDVHSNLAFFPLLPWLERAVSAVTPLSYADAGLAVSTLASIAAAWGIFAVADHLYGRRAGICAVLLWAVLPVGIVQSMAYTESLFTALAAWSLYALLTGRWLIAGTLAALAGLTRPVGVAVVAAVWVAGVVSFIRQRGASLRSVRQEDGSLSPVRQENASPPSPRQRSASGSPIRQAGASPPSVRQEDASPPSLREEEGESPPSVQRRGASPSSVRDGSASVPDGAPALRRALGMLLAPLGAAGYVLWVGHRTGDGLLGYVGVQAGWGNGFDGGWAFARFVADKFTSFPSALAGAGLLVGVALVVWLYVVGVRQGQPLSLLVYTGVVVALALCAASYFGSKPRLLMPAFPLLLPLATALARLRTPRSAVILSAVAVASAAYGAFWLNGTGPP